MTESDGYVLAKIYSHPKGYQVVFWLYAPNGAKRRKYKLRSNRSMAEELCRRAADIEKGSRAGNLSRREISEAIHLGILNEAEASEVLGGVSVAVYDLDRILDRYETASMVRNTSYAHSVNMGRVKYLKEWFLAHPIPLLKVADVEEWICRRLDGTLSPLHPISKRRRQSASPKTVQCELTIFQAILDEAVSLGVIGENVARQVKFPVRTQQLKRAMTGEEVAALIRAAEENRHLCHGFSYELIMVALYTGLRRGELRAIRWEDVRLEASKIVVQAHDVGDGKFTPKAGVPDIVEIPEELAPIMRGMEASKSGPFVFGGETPIPANQIYKTFKKLCLIAGLDSALTLHHARHTFVSHLLRQTGDLALVQRAARHLDLTTTKGYIHTVETVDSPVKRFRY